MKCIKGNASKKNELLPWYEQRIDYLLQYHVFYESGEDQIIIIWPDEELGVVAYDNVPLKGLTAKIASDRVDVIQKEYGETLAQALGFVLYTYLTEGKIMVADFEACVRETMRQAEQRENLQLVKGELWTR